MHFVAKPIINPNIIPNIIVIINEANCKPPWVNGLSDRLMSLWLLPATIIALSKAAKLPNII
jgi:hypothetical protein